MRRSIIQVIILLGVMYSEVIDLLFLAETIAKLKNAYI